MKAYSDATIHQGVLNEVMTAMTTDVLGADWERIREMKKEIREARPEDLAEASAHIRTILEDANFCMAGNAALIRADADCFDEVLP